MGVRNKMISVNTIILLLGFIWCQVTPNVEGIHMYNAVPGLEPSPFYSFQIREVGSDNWLDAFALVTECTQEKMCDKQDGGGFYPSTATWPTGATHMSTLKWMRVMRWKSKSLNSGEM